MAYQQYGYGAPPPGPPHGYHQPPSGQPGYYRQQTPPQQYGGAYGQPPPPPQSNTYPRQAPHYDTYGNPYPPQSYPPGPPPQHGYGAPQYGAPPAQPYAGGYAAPLPQSYGPPTPASLGYGAPQLIQWDPRPDAQALRAAMKGFGTDEKTLIRILSTKDPMQIDLLKNEYYNMFRRSLESDVISETRSYFQKGLVALIQGPLLHDCHLLYDAMHGPGTKETVLNDVLLSRSNADMQAIKSKYQKTFNRSLEADIRGDLSMKTERHFLIVLGANRAEDSAPVIPQEINQDVTDLYRATEGKVGTDEMMVCSILSTRNDNQLRAIEHRYKETYQRRLADVIRKEFSGHMEEALLYQLNHAVDKYMHAAALLEDSMAGLGTKDNLLVGRVVRYHWDRQGLANIKGAYQQRYRKSLASRIKGETSGDYGRLMVACIGD